MSTIIYSITPNKLNKMLTCIAEKSDGIVRHCHGFVGETLLQKTAKFIQQNTILTLQAQITMIFHRITICQKWMNEWVDKENSTWDTNTLSLQKNQKVHNVHRMWTVFILNMSEQGMWYWPLKSLVLRLLTQMNPDGSHSHLKRTRWAVNVWQRQRLGLWIQQVVEFHHRQEVFQLQWQTKA